MEYLVKHNITIEGFATQQEASEFLLWWSNAGEQDYMMDREYSEDIPELPTFLGFKIDFDKAIIKVKYEDV